MSTRYPIEALNTARFFVKRVPIDQVGVGENIVRRALSRMWVAAPFTWTIGSNTSFNLAEGQFEYQLTYPVDYSYAVNANLILSDNLAQRPLQIVSSLEADEGFVGQPSKIYYRGAPGVEDIVRVSPKPLDIVGTPRVTSLYKRQSPTYTRAQLYNVVVPFPDDWYWVFEEAVLYEAYRYSDDNRAGDTKVQGDQAVYSGQIAAAMAGINEMKQREPLVILTGLPEQKDGNK